MDRAQKEKVVAELTEDYRNIGSVVVTHYAGLTVTQMTALRERARAAGVNYKVSKNRLVLRAIEGTQYEGIGPLLKGPVGLATSEDPVAAAKIVCEFAKDNDKLVVLGGALGEKTLDEKGVVALSKLPSLDEMRATLLALVQTPATHIARIAREPAAQMARVIKAYADKV